MILLFHIVCTDIIFNIFDTTDDTFFSLRNMFDKAGSKFLNISGISA